MGAPGSPVTDLNLDSPAVITARTELAACFQLAALHGLEEGGCNNHFSAIAQRAYEQMRLGDAESARAHLHSAMRRLSKGQLPRTIP